MGLDFCLQIMKPRLKIQVMMFEFTHLFSPLRYKIHRVKCVMLTSEVFVVVV